MTESALFTWTVVMPVKVLARAKSRLAVLAGPRRSELALALASDTVCAVLACPRVARLLVVTADPVAGQVLGALGAGVIDDEPAGGLNAALVHGASVALRRWPGTGVAALAADLPALRPAELARALVVAATIAAAGPVSTGPVSTGPASSGPASSGAFVADAAGIGTTMYAAPPGAAFLPSFGGASRARHASGGAREIGLRNIPGLRRDVDTPDDLRAAVALGTGTRTASLAGELLGV